MISSMLTSTKLFLMVMKADDLAVYTGSFAAMRIFGKQQNKFNSSSLMSPSMERLITSAQVRTLVHTLFVCNGSKRTPYPPFSAPPAYRGDVAHRMTIAPRCLNEWKRRPAECPCFPSWTL